MSAQHEERRAEHYWFVGSMHGGTDDQTSRFLREGIWENGYLDKYTDLVNAVQVGDRIAIKSTYTRRRNLPFDGRGHAVSAMAIKATGVVRRNVGDGRTLEVDWRAVTPAREWYFYTYRATVWRVQPGDWAADALIRFAFDDEEQDLDLFRNAAFWRGRFGDDTAQTSRFTWTAFYEAVADKLLEFADRRAELLENIRAGVAHGDELPDVVAHLLDGSSDAPSICPFTVMALFNMQVDDTPRRKVAAAVAAALGVTEQVPATFEGIPVLDDPEASFVRCDEARDAEHIDAMWDLFAQAVGCAESEAASDEPALDEPGLDEPAFRAAYDHAIDLCGGGWSLTTGLSWTRPWGFLSLDEVSQRYLTEKLSLDVGLDDRTRPLNAEEYLALTTTVQARFCEDTCPVHSFPELAYAASRSHDVGAALSSGGAPSSAYGIDDISREGCFVEQERLSMMLERLRTKKNVILQGPPGTGKTWLAKRLAYALVGQRPASTIRAVQFHPNLSYEDFVRGWRPSGDGKLTLVDGPFVQTMKEAQRHPSHTFVVVIEEINRGNPAQVFGELLTLLEADKRTPDAALELAYSKSAGELVFIPSNVYVIGTMNIADRSLALVDLALRRRFAFIDLEPTLGAAWRDWMQSRHSVDKGVLADIEQRMTTLNEHIAGDVGLGPQFRVGHSYVTPSAAAKIPDPADWFRQVVATEIGPLLEEYWFDDLDKARAATARLLAGL